MMSNLPHHPESPSKGFPLPLPAAPVPVVAAAIAFPSTLGVTAPKAISSRLNAKQAVGNGKLVLKMV